MSFWEKARKFLFGSGGKGDEGLYYYVRLYNVPDRPTPKDEIVKIRINPMNDISQDDEGNHFVRKVIVGNVDFRRGELLLYFDQGRKLTGHEVTGGALVSEKEYEQYVAGRSS